MNELGSQIMAIVVPAITTVLGILVTWGLAELRRFIKTKTDAAAAIQAFDTVADLVHSSVASLNQTTRKVFEDGKLSESEKRQYKTRVMAEVLGQIPDATMKILDANVVNLGNYVNNRIESEVFFQPKPKGGINAE